MSAFPGFVPEVQVVSLLDRFRLRWVRVVPAAGEQEGAIHGEPADPPAPRLVAVVPAGVHPRVPQQAETDDQDTEQAGEKVVPGPAVKAEEVQHGP